MATMRSLNRIAFTSLVISFLTAATGTASDSPENLSVSISTDKAAYSQTDPIQCTIRIKNTSPEPIDIPLLDALSTRRYLTITVATTSDIPIFFLSTELDAPIGAPPAFQTLSPGAEISVQETLNDSGSGFLGYVTSGNHKHFARFTGAFQIVATFAVTKSSLPPNPGPNAFVGSVSSTGNGLSPLIVNSTLGDVNGDGIVNCADINIVKASFSTQCGQVGFDARADVNQDCVVDVRDLAIVSQQLPAGTTCK